MKPHILFLLGGAMLGAIWVESAEWRQYRGSNHDGTYPGKIRSNWPEEPPAVVWKVPLDPGLSSLSVGEGKVFTQVRRAVGNQDQEVCIALDAGTGDELWATPLGRAFYPNGGVGSDDGPRSTPAVAGGLVFVFTSYLRLAALEAETGRLVWSRDMTTELGAQPIEWQNAASPVVEGSLVIVNGNGPDNQCLLAFHVEDGALAWKGHSDQMTHATPIAATLEGVRQIIFLAQSGLVSIVPETGSVLWRHPLNYNRTSVAASPVLAGDMVFASRAYPAALFLEQAGAVVIRPRALEDGFLVEPVWSKVNQLMNHWSTPVYFEGHFYGLFGQTTAVFQCVEAVTGEITWTADRLGHGSVVVAGGLILAVSERGELVLADPDPSTYTELGRFKALEGKCWNAPALSDGRIYLRSTLEGICLDISPATQARLKLEPVLSGAGSAFQLRVGREDGAAIQPAQAANFEVLSSTNLSTGWRRITEALVFEDGQLIMEDGAVGETPQRYFQVQEKP